MAGSLALTFLAQGEVVLCKARSFVQKLYPHDQIASHGIFQNSVTWAFIGSFTFFIFLALLTSEAEFDEPLEIPLFAKFSERTELSFAASLMLCAAAFNGVDWFPDLTVWAVLIADTGMIAALALISWQKLNKRPADIRGVISDAKTHAQEGR